MTLQGRSSLMNDLMKRKEIKNERKCCYFCGYVLNACSILYYLDIREHNMLQRGNQEIERRLKNNAKIMNLN